MKARIHRVVWTVLLSCCLLAAPAAAQVLNFERLAAGEDRLSLTMGIDPAVLGAVAYTRTIEAWQRPIALSIEVALPVAGLDVRDYRVLAGAQMSALQVGRWRLAGQGQLVSRGTRNDIFDAHSFGVDFTAYWGYYGQARFAAVDVGFDKAVATYIAHREWYRDTIYSGAVDGWYAATGGTWHTGAAAGVDVAGVELAARANLHWSEGGSSWIPPITGTLSVAYVF